MRPLNWKTTPALLLFFVFALAACDSSSPSAPSQPSAPTPIGTPQSRLALEPGEKEIVLAANEQPVDVVIVAMETIIEKRAQRGASLRISELTSALDEALEIHCQNLCVIKEREQ